MTHKPNFVILHPRKSNVLSIIDNALHYANYLTRLFENNLTSHAIAAAYYHGENKLGLTGRELWEYASEGGAKTQSQYDYGNIPGALRIKELSALLPFQTFAFEVFNTMRELGVTSVPIIRRIAPKTGIHETIAADSKEGKATLSNRIKMFGQWAVAMYIVNLIADKAIGRKPWEIKSFIPLLSQFLGGYSARAPLMPQRLLVEGWKGVESWFIYGNPNKFLTWATRYFAPAGVEATRIAKGLATVILNEGKVKDIKGKTMFEADGFFEQFLTIIAGPWMGTKEGRAKLRALASKRGLIGTIKLLMGRRERARGKRTKPLRP